MTIVAPPAAAPASPAPDIEPRVRALGRQIAAGQAKAGRSRTRALEDRGMELLSRDPALRAALFRLVDVAPACADRRDLAAHLASLLGEAERPGAPAGRADGGARARSRLGAAAVGAAMPAARGAATGRAGGPAVGAIAGLAVHRMATRLHRRRRPGGRRARARSACGSDGAAASVDLLGEATVTAAEADRYARRCDDALRTLAQRGPPVARPPHARRRSRAST